jgi:hypothetical protein
MSNVFVQADTETIKVTVDSLSNEANLNDNTIEKEVSITDEEFTDIGIVDITVSPLYINQSSSVTVTVGKIGTASY